ncbi:MAG: hypothetical protein ACI4JB_03125 [Porcipelethomonas sp.]
MPDYKELFYKSQITIADTIEKLDMISKELKEKMMEYEDEIISSETNNGIHVSEDLRQ